MKRRKPRHRFAEHRFAVCIDNRRYEASLERNKIYVVLRDKDAQSDGDIRVLDESGEDYLFSADRFVLIEVPPRISKSLLQGSRRQSQRRRR